MKTNPCITVLMPAYNTEKYIGEAIESVLQQTYTDFELVIVNDGSTDGTRAIINSYKDERIILIDQPNMGVAAALNTGLKYSKAPYIARFDADDVCHPQRLEKQIKFLLENPEYILVGSDADYILENNDFLFHFHCIAHSHKEIMEKLYFYCPFMHPTVMYKKANVANAGGYPTDAHNFEDYLLWTAIAKQGKFCNLAEPLIKYRLNPASVTIDERWRGRRFRELKRDAIKRGHITAEEGNELLAIIKSQDVRKIKEGSYHALCGKKFLANNYQPEKAREHVKKAISIRPLRLDNYLLYTVSYLPEKFILWLHRMSPNKL
ncbi:glycosyltransferase [Mucilaginibacter sp.]|uniref:glycosyltransferase n=1 Tax=Mucilaginibacter sp. TaxID=1882438 RepID=UPI00262C747F|nr:glycosyltransferase [Mucilaginibacter sp.]MDB5030239.1 glycosyltransferase [Mucilaginibacter sp.]